MSDVVLNEFIICKHMILNRLTSILRYFSWADPLYRWKLRKGECPLCGNSYFISFKDDPFLTRCFKCKGNITNLAMINVIKVHVAGDFDQKVYELSSYGSTLDFLKKKFSNVTFSEFFPDKKLGEYSDDILNQDVQKLTFSDHSFDVVTSNQVFEHVPNDIKGFSECLRVLNYGGALIFTVPLYDTAQTTKKASLINNEIVFVGEPEYHDSRLGGAKSSPVFHRHSVNDICERVKSVGFSSVELKDVWVVSSQGKPQKVIYAVKG